MASKKRDLKTDPLKNCLFFSFLIFMSSAINNFFFTLHVSSTKNLYVCTLDVFCFLSNEKTNMDECVSKSYLNLSSFNPMISCVLFRASNPHTLKIFFNLIDFVWQTKKNSNCVQEIRRKKKSAN